MKVQCVSQCDGDTASDFLLITLILHRPACVSHVDDGAAASVASAQCSSEWQQ